MSYCAKCGAPLPPGAQFCPRCGTPLAVAPAAPAPVPAAPVAPPPAAPSRFPWWIVPLVLLVLGGLAWLLLAGLPFGGRERQAEAPRVETETIAEGAPVAPSSPRETGTIVDVEGERPQVTPKPQVSKPAAPEPRAADPQPSMLNDEQASATLREYVTSRDYYDDVDDDCVRVESRGFRNRGFDYGVWNSCERGGGSRLLGRWRVDALTREVFRQYDDGRYLRP